MDIPYLFTKSLALITLFGNAFAVALLLFYFLSRPFFDRAFAFLGKWAIALGFAISTASTVGSLIYSEVVGFPACILCWIQRVFMYPLMFLFGLALLRKERMIMAYAMLLSIIGGGVAVYQWTKDMLALYSDVTMPCPAVSLLPSCDKIYVLEYGYITIPMIALNAFIWIIIVMYAGIRNQKEVL